MSIKRIRIEIPVAGKLPIAMTGVEENQNFVAPGRLKLSQQLAQLETCFLQVIGRRVMNDQTIGTIDQNPLPRVKHHDAVTAGDLAKEFPKSRLDRCQCRQTVLQQNAVVRANPQIQPRLNKSRRITRRILYRRDHCVLENPDRDGKDVRSWNHGAG